MLVRPGPAEVWEVTSVGVRVLPEGERGSVVSLVGMKGIEDNVVSLVGMAGMDTCIVGLTVPVFPVKFISEYQ